MTRSGINVLSVAAASYPITAAQVKTNSPSIFDATHDDTVMQRTEIRICH